VTARKARLAAAGLFLLSFVGLWLGHTLEYARVWGTAGLREELTGSVHGYMVLVALALAVLAGASALVLWRVWSALGRRVDAARSALAGTLRGRPVALDRTTSSAGHRPVSFGTRLAGLWLLLTVVQVGLFLVQENVEQVAAGYPAPGFGPITGTHWAAALVHATVALVLATLTTLVARAFGRRATVVSAVEALVRVLLSILRRPLAIRPRVTAWQPAPLQAHGCQLWSRPPPLRRAVLTTG
jgi:hypothetical protein